ncbi:MAG: fumarate reductase (quinol) flavoprotein subunit [Rickettsiales bacterium]|nr:MAG: fumarate reductase (quinol) flavoprotein subunit [Rickettsiales bacterium]
MPSIFKTEKHYHDVLIIGSGGSGLAAGVFAANKNLDVAIISKVHPLNSHTVAAQGGINASLGNVTPDDWRWHMYDTLKASHWLADQDSVEEMCKGAGEVINMLDQLGVEFDRNKNGKIDQKIYGGHTTEFGQGGLAFRACYSKDKTGHSIMHKLFQHATEKQIAFYNYNFSLELIMQNERCCGVLCLDMEKGILNVITAGNVIIASGGYSQIYATATSSAAGTGDGCGLVAGAGGALQDMEFVQFHPTALRAGVLITEAARSAGGKLLNGDGERFMKKYAPKFMELAPRDIVARAISTEISQGRGCGAEKNHVFLDLTHLSREEIKENLPTIFENCSSFGGIDPSEEYIPIAPAAHYTMGGIATNSKCQVISCTETEKPITGLYAIGEAACISVHGAGRLGCNSLLDLLVFAKKAVESLEELDNSGIGVDAGVSASNILTNFEQIFKGEIIDIDKMTRDLRNIMSMHVGIFREKKGLQSALVELMQLKEQYEQSALEYQPLQDKSSQDKSSQDESLQDESLQDKSSWDEFLQWNIELQHYLELGNMLISAIATTESALWRCESRGAHWRQDFPETSDEFLGHTIFKPGQKENPSLRPIRKSVNNVGFDEPNERNY